VSYHDRIWGEGVLGTAYDDGDDGICAGAEVGYFCLLVYRKG